MRPIRNLRSLLLVVFVEVAPGRNRGIPGASKSRTTLPPYYTCHEGDVRWANISLGFAKYFIGFAKYSPSKSRTTPYYMCYEGSREVGRKSIKLF